MIFNVGKKLRQASSEERDESVVFGSEDREEVAFKGGVVGLWRVEVSADAVAASEGGGGHEGSVKDVTFLDFRGVKKDGEADGVKDGDDPRVGGYEWAGWHVGSEHSWSVLFYPGEEELVLALDVEVVETVFEGTKEGKAMASRDGFQ